MKKKKQPVKSIGKVLIQMCVAIINFFKIKLNSKILKILTFLPVVVGNYISKISYSNYFASFGHF